jgi:hypothetical protein
MKNNKIKLGGFNRFVTIIDFLKGALKTSIKENESLVRIFSDFLVLILQFELCTTPFRFCEGFI